VQAEAAKAGRHRWRQFERVHIGIRVLQDAFFDKVLKQHLDARLLRDHPFMHGQNEFVPGVEYGCLLM
jgi:hypothetical protein